MRKRSSAFWRRSLLPLCVVFLISCGGVQRNAIFVGESDPVDFTLSNTVPERFKFEIPQDAKGPFDFAIELTYFENQMQGWDALPLYYTLLSPDSTEGDKRFSLKLKDDKGAWRGALEENQTDRRFEDNISEGLTLAPGKYELKLFGDNKDLAKPILGIVHVAFKVYAH